MAPRPATPEAAPPRRILIVGAGAAGLAAAARLRDEGYDGELTMVSTEAEPPYHRSTLSSAFLLGTVGEDAVEFDVSALDLDLRLAAKVNHIDVATRIADLEDEHVSWDRLLLATGSRPATLTVPGSGLDGVDLLHTLHDARALREAVERKLPMVVVGCGWLGCEVAAAARSHGCHVTMCGPESQPLERVLGAELGRVLAERHQEAGVELRPGVRVERFLGHHRVEAVQLSDGSRVEAATCLVAVGSVPNTELARQIGAALAHDRAVLTDDRLRTSVPGVFAAGDIVAVDHPLFGEAVHDDHWGTAEAQGHTAGANLVDGDESFRALPHATSEQYELELDRWGWAPRWDRVVIKASGGSQRVALYLRDGVVRAACTLARPDLSPVVAGLVTHGVTIDGDDIPDQLLVRM